MLKQLSLFMLMGMILIGCSDNQPSHTAPDKDGHTTTSPTTG
jgi:hypothetical protein